jgi:hypothetical protein
MLFMVDAIGALLSSLLLFAIAKKFSLSFGLSESVLLKLSFVALLMAFYSILCYIGIKHSWKSFLISISVINLVYCAITFLVLVYHWPEITALGIAYLSVEIMVILFLSYFEFSTAKAIL